MKGTSHFRVPLPLLYRERSAGDAQEQQLGARAASPAAACPAGLSARPRASGHLRLAHAPRRAARRVAMGLLDLFKCVSLPPAPPAPRRCLRTP
jgi:hypothetical protein